MDAIAWVLGIGIAVYLLFRFPKKMLILLGVLAVVAAGLGAWLYIADNQSRWQREAVSLSITYNLEECSPDMPLRITVHNGARRDVVQSRMVIRGFRDGYSTPLYERADYSSDRIFEVGQTLSGCFVLPYANPSIASDILAAHPPETLEWRVSLTSAFFRY